MKRIIKMLSMLILVGTLIAADTMSVSAATLKDLFDAEYYSSTYADLEAAFGDNEEALYQHFLTYGLMEGRNASPYFDIRVYREKYADLDAAFGNDWEKYAEHYLIYGLEEGRDGGGEFDAVSYAKRYPDLYEAFGYDLVQLKAHYETYGVQENRDSVSETIVEEQERIAKEAEDAQVQEQEQTPSSERVEEIFDGDGFRYIIIYDAAGNIIKASVYDAANIYYGSEVFEYDSEGNCISDCVTLADGSGFEYKYRADGGYVFVEKNSSGAVVSKEERDAYHLIYEENNGVITIDYEYVDGNKLIHKYDEGMIWRTEEYNEDSLMRVVEYYASGTKYREILFGEDGTVQEVIYNEDGTVYEE